MYVEGQTVEECVQILYSDLTKLSSWFEINKLKLNIEKSKVMVFDGNLNYNISLSGYNLEVVNEIKYLGIIIDNELNFKNHVNYLCKKISKKVNFFYRIRNQVSVMSAIKIYNTMIKPYFEYCSTIIAFSTNETLDRLQKLQNRSMRIILKCNRYTSVDFMLNSLKWLNINQRLNYNVLIFVLNMRNKMLPAYLCNRLVYGEDVHHHFLRNIFNFRLNFFRNEAAKKTVMYMV